MSIRSDKLVSTKTAHVNRETLFEVTNSDPANARAIETATEFIATHLSYFGKLRNVSTLRRAGIIERKGKVATLFSARFPFGNIFRTFTNSFNCLRDVHVIEHQNNKIN